MTPISTGWDDDDFVASEWVSLLEAVDLVAASEGVSSRTAKSNIVDWLSDGRLDIRSQKVRDEADIGQINWGPLSKPEAHPDQLDVGFRFQARDTLEPMPLSRTFLQSKEGWVIDPARIEWDAGVIIACRPARLKSTAVGNTSSLFTRRAVSGCIIKSSSLPVAMAIPRSRNAKQKQLSGQRQKSDALKKPRVKKYNEGIALTRLWSVHENGKFARLGTLAFVAQRRDLRKNLSGSYRKLTTRSRLREQPYAKPKSYTDIGLPTIRCRQRPFEPIDPNEGTPFSKRGCLSPAAGNRAEAAMEQYTMRTSFKSAAEYAAAIDRAFDQAGEPKHAFQIHARSLKVCHDNLQYMEAPALVESIALTLDALGVDDRQGMLIGHLRGESDPERGLYRFYLSGVASPRIANLLENLNAFPQFRDPDDVEEDDDDLQFYDPIGERVIVKPLASSAQESLELLNPCWPQCEVVINQRGFRSRVQVDTPMPEGLASQVQSWLEKWSSVDLTVLIGVGEVEGNLVRTHGFHNC